MGGAVFCPCCLTWGQTMVEVVKIMVSSFKMSCACTAALIACDLAAGHSWPTPLLETPGHSWASLGWSLVGSLLLSPGFECAQGSVCALQESVSPVLCKFWWLYGRVNADLLQEGLCHTRSAAPRAPAPAAVHCWPGPPRETPKHSSVSVCGVSESWCIQGLFEPSEHLWQLRHLILNLILPLLSSCWGFSFALGCELSFFFFFWYDPKFFSQWLFSSQL